MNIMDEIFEITSCLEMSANDIKIYTVWTIILTRTMDTFSVMPRSYLSMFKWLMSH